jgi:hypothetical protein
MKIKISILFSYCLVNFALADEPLITEDPNVDHVDAASSYISKSAYTQNPYNSLTSLGGTQVVTESQLENDSVAKKWFGDGTWNVAGAATYYNQNNAANYGYAANIFAQTGYVNGFAFGTLLTIANPISLGVNPSAPINQAQDIPINYTVTPQELYVEYQYKNIVQVDAGWIGINNVPWLTYYQNNALNVMTYQGVSVNLNPSRGWLLTALAFNSAQIIGETGFSQLTLYNQNDVFNQFGLSGLTSSQGSPGTIAVGSTWNSYDQNLNVRLWGYQFYNYANLAYADSSLKLPVNKDLYFTLAAQAAVEQPNGADVLQTSGYGTASSNAVGFQVGLNYKIWGLQLAYNNISGPSNGYASGDIVSPYTYLYATDPLYTTGFLSGLIELASGNAYKIAPTLNLLDDNLQILPSYEYFATTYIPATTEYDLQLLYNIPQIKGLSLFGGFGYLQQDPSMGGNSYQAQIFVNYL